MLELAGRVKEIYHHISIYYCSKYIFIYLFECTGSYLLHVGLSTLTRSNPGPLHWEHRVLAHWVIREVPNVCFV